MASSQDEFQYWLGFSLLPGIGPKRLLQIRQYFGSLADAWHASPGALSSAGLTPQAVDFLSQRRKTLDIPLEVEKVRKSGAWLLTLEDDRYPVLLKRLDDAPPVLYVRGTVTPTDHLSIAIVGTRKVTRYGQDVTRMLAQELAERGVTIVSGLAHGVDAIAHKSAIQAQGRTIAVLGCGIDVMYPVDHASLAQQIVVNGAIISEFPLGTRPIGVNFPRRNRIISGLSLGVLVTEAPENSGSLITAGFAADQGREVFAVPSNIFNALGQGTNRLIQDGAKLVMDATDILDEINVTHNNIEISIKTEQFAPATDNEAHILKYLEADPIHIDDLTRLCGLPVAEVSSTLTILELKGVAQMVGHMQYCRVFKR